MKRSCVLLALACWMAGTLWAADCPFCGKWKLNTEKSNFAGEQIKIQDLGGNRYKWTVGNISDTITYDGTEQAVKFGRMLSMTPEGANNWKMVIKKDGRVISSMIHAISEDGKTQTIKGTDIKPDGTTSDFSAVWKKVSGGAGWGGTWETSELKFTSPDQLAIDLYQGDGLTFVTPADNDKLSMKFDGKDYEEIGPNVAPGSMSSGKRVNARVLDLTNKVKGQVLDHTRYEVSADGKTLSLTIREPGQPKPLLIVYDKI